MPQAAQLSGMLLVGNSQVPPLFSGCRVFVSSSDGFAVFGAMPVSIRSQDAAVVPREAPSTMAWSNDFESFMIIGFNCESLRCKT